MAQVIKRVTAAKPAATKTVARNTRPAGSVVVNGFTILNGVEIPPRTQARSSEINDLLNSMEPGQAVDIPVGEDQKNISKQNSLYNAAKRNSASVVIRVQEPGKDGKGGVLRMWYTGQREAAATK